MDTTPFPFSSARWLPAGRWRGWILGLLGTGSLLAAFPPLSIWPLALVGPWFLILLAVEAPTARAAWGRFVLAGVAYSSLGSLWMAETSFWNLVPVVVIESFWIGLLGVACKRCSVSQNVWPTMPILWVAHELCRNSFPDTGYPYQFVGLALAASPVLVQVADLGGVFAVTFLGLSLLPSVQGGLSLFQKGTPFRRSELFAAVASVAALGYGVVRPETLGTPEPGPVVAGIQPAFPQELKEAGTSRMERFQACLDLSVEAVTTGETPDLLVWPETMWPWPIGEGQGAWFSGGFGESEGLRLEKDTVQRVIVDLTEALGGSDAVPHLLLGTFYYRGQGDGQPPERRNSAMLFDPSGIRLARYDKHILVPGGEAIPFGGILPEGLREAYEKASVGIAGFMATLTPGDGVQLMEVKNEPFAVTICFENAYGDYHRRFVWEGARYGIVLSNEGWFHESSEFDLMILHSILRAVETRRSLFRSTNSGISCLVLPDGSAPDRLVVDGKDRNVAGVFSARIPLYSGLSPYVWWGDLFAWLCLGLGLLATSFPRRIRLS